LSKLIFKHLQSAVFAFFCGKKTFARSFLKNFQKVSQKISAASLNILKNVFN